MTSAYSQPDAPTLVPAIARMTRVLSALLDMPTGGTLSEIARRADMSKSTASNLLRTMVGEGVLNHDDATRRFELGPLLVELGAVAIGRTTVVAGARRAMARLVDRTGLACLAIQRMPDGHFLVIEKIESHKDIKITIGLGERFPADSPLLSRLWHAWQPDEPALPRRAYTPATLTAPAEILTAEDEVRRRGFAFVIGEYIPNLNVVGFPVFDPDAQPRMIVTLLGMGQDLSPDQVSELEPDLLAAARSVTIATGGSLPPGYPGGT